MTVHFIGAGPGAADLITLRGARLLAACPVCLYAGSIVAQLTPLYGAECPVAIVFRASWPEERIIRGTLADISEKLAAEPVERSAIVFVGASLGAENFRESSLYDAHYQRRFRGRDGL